MLELAVDGSAGGGDTHVAMATSGSASGSVAAFDGTSSISTTPALRGITSVATEGVWGESSDGSGYGVFGDNSASSASGGAAVFGWGRGTGCIAVGAQADAASGYAIQAEVCPIGQANYSRGIYVNTNGYGSISPYFVYAGYFGGDVKVVGNLTKSGGSFLIDHPLDPANSYLEHSFMESPERKNLYDGTGMANSAGEFEVQLPAYFDALNQDFRYQLTALGGPAPNLHVKQEFAAGRFVIAGAGPGQKVSWQVTGVRKDAWALENPLVVEREKPAHERGLYSHPEAYGLPRSKGIDTTSRRRTLDPPRPPASTPT